MNTWIDMHTFIPYLFAFLFWGFQDLFKKISWKWYVGAIIFTVSLALIFPLVGLKSYVNEVAIISESLMIVFSYKLMIKRLSGPVTFFSGLLVGLFGELFVAVKEEFANFYYVFYSDLSSFILSNILP